VGLDEEICDEIQKEMAVYAQSLDDAESKKFDDDLENFVHAGNVILDFDPSDDEVEEEVEEDDEVMEDPMGDVDLEILKKFFLTSAEMTEDKLFRAGRKKRQSQADVWASALPDLRMSCESLAQVIELMLIIPSSTAELERFFKVLKEMKSKKRNRLSAKKLRKMFLIYHFLDLDNHDKERVHELFQKHLRRE